MLAFHKIQALGLLATVLLILQNVRQAHCIQFHRNTTGVAFSAYVHSKGPETDWKSYSIQDLKMMMQVISGRFSKVATFGMGATNDPYEWNKTYYQSYSQVFTGEAAALVNKELMINPKNNMPLSVYLGIWMNDGATATTVQNDISLALESAKKSNVFYRNTVKGFIFSKSDLNTNVSSNIEIFSHMQGLKGETSTLGLKLGTRQLCQGLGEQGQDDQNLLKHQTELLKQLDFIICEVDAVKGLGASGASSGVKAKLLHYRTAIKAINPSIEVMAQTGFPAKADKSFDVDAMMEFWQIMDAWALEQNFTVWMLEAFDNPWKNWNEDVGHYGWWRLMDDAKTGMVQGYVEKIDQPKMRTEEPGQGTTPTSVKTTTNKPKKQTGQKNSVMGSKVGREYFVSFLVGIFAVLLMQLDYTYILVCILALNQF